MNLSKNPWSWVPSLYFAEGIPYVAVMTIAVIMYKRLGISNSDIALYTSWLYLPWVIKPFWSPFVDLYRTKRWWIVVMQFFIAMAFAGIAFTIPTSFFFQTTLAFFWLVGFTSATHDIAADGFYMLGLNLHQQSFFVGIRSTFYRISTIVGQGLLVILAGIVETNTGLEPVRLKVTASPTEVVVVDQPQTGKNVMAFHFISTPLVSEESLIEKAKKENISNGFIVAEKTTEKKKDEATALSKWYHVQIDILSQWLRAHFGEERKNVIAKKDRQVMIGVTLNKKPEAGEIKVLNIAFKDGDNTINLEQNAFPTRFEFNEKNWNKPAYIVLHTGGVKKKTIAEFEGLSGNIPSAWVMVFVVLSIFFLAISIYHNWILPKPVADHATTDVTASSIVSDFLLTFKTFFTKDNALAAILFMLFFRLPEAQLIKLINPFLLDSIDKGGIGLTTGEVGFVYGTVGIIGLTLGGILGGIVVAHGGLKRWLWPMVCAITLPDLVYVYLSYVQDQSLFAVNCCIFIEQFGYGFGFTAYMLFLIYFSAGEHKAAHYAICTGFMALGMMLPGMAAGWLQETIGYRHFFVWTILCCVVTFIVCLFLKIDSNFGKKTGDE